MELREVTNMVLSLAHEQILVYFGSAAGGAENSLQCVG